MTTPAPQPETPRLAYPARAQLGEGALWDHRTGHLLFVDIKDPAVCRFEPVTGAFHRLPLPERVGFVALTPDTDIVVAGLKSGLAKVHLFGGQTQPLVAPEPHRPGNRINDGHVGPDGILYFGTMDDGEAAPTGSFWAYDGATLTEIEHGIPITNGPAASPDGRILYSIDTLGRTIRTHPVEGGQVGPSQVHIRFEDGWGNPDGAAVDAEGHLWVCHWGGSRITRFRPDGTVERTVAVPAAQVTKCAFGGPDLTTLFITTAAAGTDPARDPQAGHLFAVEVGIRGLAANVFGG